MSAGLTEKLLEMSDLQGVEMKSGSGKQWDFCFVFPVEDKKGIVKKKRGLLVRSLRHVNLIVSRMMSRDDDEVFLRVAAPANVLEWGAEKMGLKMRLKEEHGGGFETFTRARKDLFALSSEGGFFSSAQRQQVIVFLMEARKVEGGAEIDIDMWRKKKWCLHAFPLHDRPAKSRLLNDWVRATSVRSLLVQPLNQIREYFGEKVAIYFAWLGFYTAWLVPLSLFGLIVFITQIADQDFDSPAIPFYCLFLAFWATLFLEFWKRKNATLAFKWDVMDFEEEERTRPDHEGVEVRGYYFGNIFVEDKRDPPLAPWEIYDDPKKRKSKYIGALSVITPIIIVVIIATIGIMALRIILRASDMGKTLGGIVGGVVNALFIGVMNAVYGRLAAKLTDWENHRTDTMYEDSLIAKSFVFQFVNSYISLFYIAFVKPSNPTIFGEDDECLVSCIGELTSQLGTIFVTQMVVGQFKEVAVPYLVAKAKLRMEDRSLAKAAKQASTGNLVGAAGDALTLGSANKRATDVELQSKYAMYESTFDDYKEMIIQFGYVTLFAAAFPLTSMFALLNNLMEIRTDGLKLLTATKRPVYQGAEDIGTWYWILEIMGVIAVGTNCGVVGFTSNQLEKFNDDEEVETKNKLWFVVISEHVILFIKFMLGVLIPDTPYKIQKEIAQDEYAKRIIHDNEDTGEHIAEWNVASDDDTDDMDMPSESEME